MVKMSKEESLKMFLWDSELEQEYGLGQLIVMAMNIEEARNKIRAYFREKDRFSLHEITYEESMNILEKDISGEPTIYIESEVIRITGSE